MKSFLIALCAASAASLAACDYPTTQKKLADAPTAGPFSPANAATPPAKAPEADANTALASRVMKALEGMHIEGIDVTAADGAITLWGSTAGAPEAKRAAAAAAKIDGVKSVDNRLIVVKGS
jgi:osmotically-inducible protein OsmY